MQPGRKEHVVTSFIQEPRLKVSKFEQFRGWVNENAEFRAFVGSLEEAARLKCDQFVELGVKTAMNSNCITRVLNTLGRKSELTCVDLDKAAQKYFKERNIPQDGPCKSRFVLASSFEYAKEFDKQCAWVFIDGCHCFHCTTKDLEAWCPKIVKGGIVIFHDCDWRVQLRPPSQRIGHKKRQPVGVYDAQFKSEYLQEEFYLVHYLEGAIDPKRMYWNGMGIWRKK
jgi:hypothetical protein